MVRGTATLSDDLEELRRCATAVGARYRNAVPGELLVRITPTRIIAEADPQLMPETVELSQAEAAD